MVPNNTKKPTTKVELRIIDPIPVKWKCPDCGETNYTTFPSITDLKETNVQCSYCGKVFIGEATKVY